MTCLVSAALAGSPPLSQPGPVDPLVEPLIQPQATLAMALSPDGRRAAAIVDTGVMKAAVVLDLVAHKRKLITNAELNRLGARKAVEQPINVNWLNDDMIAVDFRGQPTEVYSPDGRPLMELGRSLLSQQHDNGKLSDWVLVASDGPFESFTRVNVRTGERRKLTLDVPGDVLRLGLDGSGAIRTVETLSSTGILDPAGRIAHWYRRDESQPWQKLEEHAAAEPGWTVMDVPVGDGPLTVLARNGRDTLALWHYDPATHAFGDLIAGDDVDDIVGLGVWSGTSTLRSVTTGGLLPRTIWLDPTLARVQHALDQALPGRRNVLVPGDSANSLVHSFSDRDPGRWYVYDGTTHEIELIGVNRPAVDPQRMSPTQALHYRAADGLQVPAYLTLPGLVATPVHALPLVVLVHGGLQMRSFWEWDEDVQALAAHGYAVLQPQYRGSGGFGLRFELAGLAQWGRVTQDDINAGVQDMVARGIADPDRICIMGSGFGGYTAMWGLARDPTLYKCGISDEGIHNLPRLMADESSYPLMREWLTVHVGERRQLADGFAAVSPIVHADRIVAPVLLINRPYQSKTMEAQGRLMQEALERAHAEVQVLRFPDPQVDAEADEIRRRIYAAVFVLLDRTIGNDATPARPATAKP